MAWRAPQYSAKRRSKCSTSAPRMKRWDSTTRARAACIASRKGSILARQIEQRNGVDASFGCHVPFQCALSV